ncbi:MAG: hypothetical protein JNM72_03675 [Deltaproteobacteria bacterium]|nr:hypothetical protein [Deltaproteobacteria bacterium]
MLADAPPPVAALADWALGLQPAQLPPMVARHARLQLLGVIGAAAALGAFGLRGDAASAAGALADAELDPGLLLSGGAAAAALVAAACAGPAHRVDDLVVAVVAANELSARCGLAQALGPRGAALRGKTAGVAAAVARARLEGVAAPALAAAISAALAAPAAEGDPGAAVRSGVAAALARPWAGGDRGALAGGGALSAAWTGLGAAWWTHSLIHRAHPGALRLLVPLQAMDEVLRRHVKAADKRLRADQIERVVVRTGLPLPVGAGAGWPGGARALPALIAALVSSHSLSLDGLRGPLEGDPARLAAVAERVVVEHDPVRALSTPLSVLEVAPQLLGGLSARARLSALGQLLRPTGLGWGPGWWRGLKRLGAAPVVEQLLAAARVSDADLAGARLEQLALRADTELVLHTTRGGSWPERRGLLGGGPAAPWEQTVAGTLALAAPGFGVGIDALRARLEVPGERAAAGWLARAAAP